MKKSRLLSLLLLLCILLGACSAELPPMEPTATQTAVQEDVSGYNGEPYTVLADNVPAFTEQDLTAQSYEQYSPLDSLGRCGQAMACVGQDLMPTEERGAIGQVKPTGWHTVKYDSVDGKYLYNRCHLIGYQLSGENANERNLITGTRYLNVTGMLPFENMVADYVKETNNHVLYRVTPQFDGDDLLAKGVELEALSVEDQGEGISVHVFCYNVQPGVEIDYATGESRLAESAQTGTEETFILNTSSRKFHRPDCQGAAQIKDSNREDYTGSREMLIEMGYEPCKQCEP